MERRASCAYRGGCAADGGRCVAREETERAPESARVLERAGKQTDHPRYERAVAKHISRCEVSSNRQRVRRFDVSWRAEAGGRLVASA